MEDFFEKITELVAKYQTSLADQGLSDEQINQKTTEHFNEISLKYYTQLMELMSESDYQAYKQSIDRQDVDGVREVIGKYQDEVKKLQNEMIENF